MARDRLYATCSLERLSMPGERSDEIEIGFYPKCTPSYTWIHIQPQDPLPRGVVFGGKLETGQNSYIGKARVEDQDPCGFFTSEDRQLHVSYGSAEHVLKDFEVLVVHDQKAITWLKCANGMLPASADTGFCSPIQATSSESFDYYWRHPEEMIVGRTCTPLTDGATYNGDALQLSRFASTEQNTCRPGKIHRAHHCLYVPYSGGEYIFHEHEMLMLKKSPGLLKQICRYVILKSMTPYPTGKLVETLPLPSRLKKYLKAPGSG